MRVSRLEHEQFLCLQSNHDARRTRAERCAPLLCPHRVCGHVLKLDGEYHAIGLGCVLERVFGTSERDTVREVEAPF